MSLLAKPRIRLKANVSGAGRQASNARSIGRFIDREQSVRNVATDAELIFQSAAPGPRSGRLMSGIRAIPTGDEVVVTARAVDPKTNFDYVAVTRFGHRKRVIIPVTKSGRPRKSRTIRRDAKGHFAPRGPAALVFTSRGRLWKMSSVRGFRPKGDWVERAMPDIRESAATEMDKTGHEIETRWAS